MADLKISQLTGATTPLAGTEVVPLVQSSTTKKVAVSDLTAGRAVSALSLTATDLTASSAVATDANKKLVSVTNTGTGDNVLATSPTLVTPNIGAATATTVNGIYQKVATATVAGSSTKTLTVSGYGGGSAMQFQIVADVGGSGAGSLNVQIQGLLSNSNYYSLVESGKFSYLNITMGSAAIGNAQFTVSIANANAGAANVRVLGIGNSDFSIAVA